MKFTPSPIRKYICLHCGQANYKHRRLGARDGECPKHPNDYSYRKVT